MFRNEVMSLAFRKRNPDIFGLVAQHVRLVRTCFHIGVLYDLHGFASKLCYTRRRESKGAGN